MQCQTPVSDENQSTLDQWSKHEEETRADDARAQFEQETNPQRRCFHATILLISVIAGTALFLMGIGQFVGIAFQELGPVSLVLRLYLLALCLLGILVELEWTKMAQSPVLHNWITRGLFYAFLGILGLQENDTASLRDENRVGDKIALTYIKVIAQIMIGIGGFYFCMGALCCQIWYNRQTEDFKRRVERGRQMRQDAERYGVHPEGEAV